MPDPTDSFLPQLEAFVLTWHGVAAPNHAARELAADLAETVAGFERQRARLRFEDEPSSFEQALRDMREPAAPVAPAAAAGEPA